MSKIEKIKEVVVLDEHHNTGEPDTATRVKLDMLAPFDAIVVVSSGFVFAGTVRVTSDFTFITKAICLRKWGVEGGLGELAYNGASASSEFEQCTDITIPAGQVICYMNLVCQLKDLAKKCVKKF